MDSSGHHESQGPVASQDGGNGRTSVMQPYLFPYLGYFQLFRATDVFVALDDAAFIKKGWVNRNRVLLQGEPYTFTVPIQKQSQHVSIHASLIAPDDGWRNKLVVTLTHAYRKAPHFETVMPLIQRVLQGDPATMDRMALDSIHAVLEYVGMQPNIKCSSAMDIDPALSGQDRILAICGSLGTKTYVNPKGGRELYDPTRFQQQGIDLRFIHMGEVTYIQGGGKPFQPALSIIDVLMWNSKEDVLGFMDDFTLEP
ncbi:MAG: WbqC family protein [Flavobacteriales bacterium]|nr:WbqC family protein [Flavobacteriales bacterium]